MNLKSILTTVLLLTICTASQAQTSKNDDMKEVCDFLKRCGDYYLATVEDDQPRVRPFGTAVIYENRLYIQTGKRKNVAQQMYANPKIEICAYDKQTGEWVRIAATAIPDERVEAKAFMLDNYPSLKSMYSADDDNTIVFYLENATATFYSFGGEPREVKF
jgi:uncharacterized pyridoxamine 5'-phosphate oxidase family protein